MPRLLIVEDDPDVAGALRLSLEALGHTADTAGSAESALDRLDGPDGPSVDLAVVDVMLPGMTGFELCRRVSAARTTPVVLLTARSDPVDVVAGLECGADDYVTKPVEPRVLDARIRAVLRRTDTSPAADRRLSFGRVTVDPRAMRVTRDGAEIGLTATEFRLLIELLTHAGQVLSRRTLLERVWDYGYVGDLRLVDACVKRLRAKIEDEPSKPVHLQTVRGVGYRFETS